MQYYRCQCGRLESWGSLPPDPCCGCQACGTTLTRSSDYHSIPAPHRLIEDAVETDRGLQPLTRCVWCSKTLQEITEKCESFSYYLKENSHLIDDC